jgi:hypothetical protein
LDNHAVETTLYSLDEAPPKQRRPRAQRHLTLYRVGVLTIGDRRELCLIKNVSAGGMLVRVYSDVPAGTRLSVELKQGEPIAGAAQWTDGDSVGVAFDALIDVVSLISLRLEGPRPRMPRMEVDCAATIRDGSTVARTKAINISQGGLRVESSAELPTGAAVVVTLNGLAPEPAVVKWRDGDCYGLAFNRLLSVSQLVAWLQARQERSTASD